LSHNDKREPVAKVRAADRLKAELLTFQAVYSYGVPALAGSLARNIDFAAGSNQVKAIPLPFVAVQAA